MASNLCKNISTNRFQSSHIYYQILSKQIRGVAGKKSNFTLFLLILSRVLFNPAPDIIYKYNRFSKTLLEKGFKFILDESITLVLFFSCLILLLLKFDLISEKQSRKKDAFEAYELNRFEIVLALSLEKITFYI